MSYLNSDDLYIPWALQIVGEIFAGFPEVGWLTSSATSATSSDTKFPLAMFRIHNEQKTASLEKYIPEPKKYYPDIPPFWLPTLFIRFLNQIYHRVHFDTNWFGVRSDRVDYRIYEADWVYEKNLEWRDLSRANRS